MSKWSKYLPQTTPESRWAKYLPSIQQASGVGGANQIATIPQGGIEQPTFSDIEWATPETLGMPEPAPLGYDPELVRTNRFFVAPVRTEQQLIVEDIIYKGLLESELIPADQRDLIKQTGNVPATYLRLSPERLGQLGVNFDPFNAEYLRELQANETKYPYWKSRLEGTELPGSAATQFTAGWGDMLNTIGATANWLGADGIGETIADAGRKYQRVTPPAEWKGVWHPNFWLRQLPRALPFTLALIPAALIGGYAGASVGIAAGLGALGQTILGAIGAAALSRPLESALEAGGAYDAALAKGLTPEEADEAADETFNKNMALTGLDAAQFLMAFAPSPIRTGNKLIRYAIVAGKLVAVGLSEAGEEAVQEIITRQALGEEIKLDEDMEQAIVLGFVMGVGLGGVGDAFTSIREGTRSRLTPELKRVYEAARQKALREGKSAEAADLAGLDAVATTPEGKSIVEEVVNQVRESEQESQNRAIADWATTTAPSIETTALAEGEAVTGEVPGVEFNPIETKVGKGYEIIQNGEPVGEISYNPNFPGVEGIVIDRIDVVPEARRQGLATQAIDRLLAEAETQGVPLYTGMLEPDGVQLLNALERRGIISLSPAPQRMLGEIVTRGAPQYAETTAMAEGETVSEGIIPAKERGRLAESLEREANGLQEILSQTIDDSRKLKGEERQRANEKIRQLQSRISELRQAVNDIEKGSITPLVTKFFPDLAKVTKPTAMAEGETVSGKPEAEIITSLGQVKEGDTIYTKYGGEIKLGRRDAGTGIRSAIEITSGQKAIGGGYYAEPSGKKITIRDEELISGFYFKTPIAKVTPEVTKSIQSFRDAIVDELKAVKNQYRLGEITNAEFLAKQRDIAERAIKTETSNVAKEQWQRILKRTESEVTKPASQMTKEEYFAARKGAAKKAGLEFPEAVKPTAPTAPAGVTSVDLSTGDLVTYEVPPTTPPPLTPVENALGRSDNESNGFMKDLQDAQIALDANNQNDLVKKWVNAFPKLRGLWRLINPNAVANKPADQAIKIRHILYHEADGKTKGVMSYLNELGSREEIFGKIDDSGVFTDGPLKGESLGDIAQQRSKWNSKLTDMQKLWLDRVKIIEDATVEYLQRNDIDIKKLSLEEGGQFATRKVWARVLEDNSVIEVGFIAAGPGRVGAKLSTEKHRVFKTEAEAREAGFKYIPYEEALYLKVMGAYKRVAQKSEADWLLSKVTWRTTGAPEELVLAAERANRKKRHSQMLLAALNRANRGERVPEATLKAIATHYPEQAEALREIIRVKQAGGRVVGDVRKLRNVAKGLIQTDTMMAAQAVAKRARAREAAMTRKVGEAIVPAPAFSGKILTGPDAQEIAEAYRQSFDQTFSRALGQVNKLNAVTRYFMLAGDVSPFQIQLIFLMGEPKTYSRAMAGSIKSLFDPKFHASQLFAHRDTIDKHRDLILTVGGGTEFTEAMARGGWLSGRVNFRPEGEAYLKTLGLFAPRVFMKTGATLLTPFQRLFETSLDLAGIYMAEAYDHLATDATSTTEIDLYINHLRGLFSSARAGISTQQRQIETAAVLAPMYNRGIAALILDLGRGNIRGHLARKSLIKGITAISFMAVAISVLRGEEPEEIIEHFNPNSSKFFTWEVAGQMVGPGSKVRSLIKLIAQSANNPDELLEFSMDNPAMRFLRGNLSPVASSGVDILTGRDYIGDPTRDGLLNFSEKIIAENLLPIWVQTTLFEGGDLGGRSVRGLAEFFGWRSYPEPLWNEVATLRDKYAQQDFRLDWGDLNREQVDKVVANHPDLKELMEQAELEGVERGSEFEQAFHAIREAAIEQRNTSLDNAASQLLNGIITKYEYDNERGYVRPYYSGGMSALYQFRDRLDPEAVEDINKWLTENQKPEDKALDEYQEYKAILIEKADLPRDWDDIDAQCEAFLAKYPKSVRDYVKRNLNRWINKLPENAKQIELMRLKGIEDETWWDDYRGAGGGGSRWSEYLPSSGTTSGSKWSKYLP